MLATTANIYVNKTESNELSVEIIFAEGRMGFVFRKTWLRRRWKGDTWYVVFKSGFSTSGYLRHKDCNAICSSLLNRIPSERLA